MSDLLCLQAAHDRALVTGGGSGLGRAVALALARAGVHVTVMGRRAEALEATRALAEGAIDVQPGNVRDEADVERVFAAAEPVPMLVHAAAGAFLSPAEDISPNGFRTVVDTGLNGAFLVLRRWARGRIAAGRTGVAVCVSSALAHREVPGAAHSSAAKAGLEALTRSLAVEWGRYGLRVNTVCPGAVSTEGADAGMWGGGRDPRARRAGDPARALRHHRGDRGRRAAAAQPPGGLHHRHRAHRRRRLAPLGPAVRAVRIGYLVDTHGADLDAVIEEGLAAERAGFHSVVVPDRHAGPTAFPGPEQLLTLLARETGRVALGTYTLVGTLVHPMKTAEQLSVVDNLSRGRLFATVSRGFLPDFWGQFGVPEERLLGRFQEAVAIWRAAFAGERFDFDGRHWQVRGGQLAPRPFQAGGWPLWRGGNAAPERSAAYAECRTADPFPVTDADWAARAGAYRRAAEARGKRPFVVQLQDAWVADAYAAAAREFGPHFARIARFYTRHGLLRHPDFASEADLTPERLGRHLVMGTPAQCRERLEWLHAERGVDYVLLCCRLSTGPSFAAAREQLARLGEEVVRPLHAAHPAPDHPAIPAACRN